MDHGLGTLTKCKGNKMDAIGVDDGENLSTGVRVCTRVGRMVTKLKDVTGIPERGSLEI
jgi:hypothetical protein